MNVGFKFPKNLQDVNVQVFWIAVAFAFVASLLFSNKGKRHGTTLGNHTIHKKVKLKSSRKKGGGKGKRRKQKESPKEGKEEPASNNNGYWFVQRIHESFALYFSSTSKETTNANRPTVQFIGMDCEMVGCGRKGSNSMLARCSLVTLSDEISTTDSDSSAAPAPKIKVLYDVYVKPTKNITDYRTKYSGIIPEHFEGENAVNWEVCQSQVKRILKSSDEKKVILVGHALRNDYQVLRYWHPRALTRDTAQFKPFMRPVRNRMLPKKLSFLAEEHLGLEIQQNIKGGLDIDHGEFASSHGEHSVGHSSIEDAAAALLLYLKVCTQWEKSLGDPLQ